MFALLLSLALTQFKILYTLNLAFYLSIIILALEIALFLYVSFSVNCSLSKKEGMFSVTVMVKGTFHHLFDYLKNR